METKVCSKCGIEKSISDFRFSCGRYRGECKKCEAIRTKLYVKNNPDIIKKISRKTYEKNKEKRHEKYIENRIKIKEYNKNYYQYHKDYYQNYAKVYRLEHRTQIENNQKKWEKNNIEKRRKYHKKDYTRRRNNPILRLQGNLRNMINTSFRRKGLRKSMKLEKICCCSMQELVNHLISTYESNYNEKWNWDFVKNVHIDHIKPLATAKTEEDVIELCHYKNLQLLKAEDNLRKGSLIIEDYL